MNKNILHGILTLLLIMCLSIARVEAADNPADITGQTQTEQLKQLFTDVTAANNHALFINYLAGLNIINGYPDGSFKPEEGLTRAQAAVILVKAAKN